MRLFEEVLEVDEVGIRDSFFALGGHSFAAIRFLERCRRELGRGASLPRFFLHPTVEELARELERDAPEPFTPLVALRPSGSRPPFFCVHSIGGSGLRFYDLARHLGPEQPFYAFQAPDPAETAEPPTIEETAASYVEAMREVRAHGPYHLGGYSFGSVVAFEMARQLRAAGEEVGLLALLDGGAPQLLRGLEGGGEKAMLAGLARDMARAAGVGIDLTHERVRELDLEELTVYALEQLKDAELVERDLGIDWLRGYLRGVTARLLAVKDYTPEPYEGTIVYFHSTETEADTAADWREAGRATPADASQGWSELSTLPVELEPIPGHHVTIMNEPLVRSLADRLRHRLDPATSPRGDRGT